MAVDFKTFRSFVSLIADAKHPIMLRGRHGIGKSELVYQFAAARGLPVVERRVSQMTEGDLVGLPVIDGNRTAWNPPDWYKEACEKPVVLFLDEVDRGTQEVRQGIFQLTDSRTINGHRLHPETLIFAAVNGGTHGAQYAVNDMDPAELDRWTAFDIEPSVGDWLDYGRAGNIHPLIVDFINDQSSHLEHKGEFEPNKIYPSRRSWKRLSDTVVKAGILERVVSVDDILSGKFDGMKGYKLGEYTALVDKVLASGRISKDMDAAQRDNVLRFFLRLPSEAGMKFYTDASKTPAIMGLILEMHKLTVDGKSVKDHVVTLLGGAKKGKK